jgi:hypothetical protein
MKHLLYIIIGFTLGILLMTGTIQELVSFSTIEGEIVMCAIAFGVVIFNIVPTLKWIEKGLKPKSW